jgi:hypothetical protein
MVRITTICRFPVAFTNPPTGTAYRRTIAPDSAYGTHLSGEPRSCPCSMLCRVQHTEPIAMETGSIFAIREDRQDGRLRRRERGDWFDPKNPRWRPATGLIGPPLVPLFPHGQDRFADGEAVVARKDQVDRLPASTHPSSRSSGRGGGRPPRRPRSRTCGSPGAGRRSLAASDRHATAARTGGPRRRD